jgi:hypothetical protein
MQPAEKIKNRFDGSTGARPETANRVGFPWTNLAQMLPSELTFILYRFESEFKRFEGEFRLVLG